MNFNLWFIDLSKRETIFIFNAIFYGPKILVRSLFSKMKSLDSPGFNAYSELFRRVIPVKKEFLASRTKFRVPQICGSMMPFSKI
jgi:hypothetical protein